MDKDKEAVWQLLLLSTNLKATEASLDALLESGIRLGLTEEDQSQIDEILALTHQVLDKAGKFLKSKQQ